MAGAETVGGGGQAAPPTGKAPASHGGARLRRRLRSLGGVALSLALTLLGLLLVTFVIGRVMPIDPVLKVVGERATQAQYDAAYQAMGLDKPLWQQFLRYVGEVAQGNFGRSISTGHPVAEDLKRVFPATLELASLGTLFGVCIGVPLGAQVVTVPGYMVWVALAYCVVGSVFAHFIGRRLIRLNYWQEWREADFRYSLVRLREYSEAVAFDRGEAASRQHLDARFGKVLGNMLQLIKAQKGLIWFTSFFQQAAIIFPFLVAAPRYFSGAIKLGDVIQISNAFGKVQDSLSWFIDSYAGLASWRATTERLTSFDRGVARALRELESSIHVPQAQDRPDRADGEAAWQYRVAGPALELEQVRCYLPSGKLQVQVAAQQAQPGDAVLVQGASGSGKSTLLRALAGIWPQASGRVVLPEHSMFLPQRPYLPHGSLRAALSYPQPSNAYDSPALQEVLHTVRMPHLEKFLDVESNWSHKLSGGEQQRVAIARALAKNPKLLLCDEPTGALDYVTGKAILKLLQDTCREKGMTVIVITHNSALTPMADRVIKIRNGKVAGMKTNENPTPVEEIEW